MFELSLSPPSTELFISLRKSVGWDNCDYEVTAKSIRNTLFWVSFYKSSQLIATGRVMGDGALYYYIQDVIVSPKYQNNGLGSELMEHIEQYLVNNAHKHAAIGLFAAKGKEGFYQKYGYLIRDGQKLGQALCKFV